MDAHLLLAEMPAAEAALVCIARRLSPCACTGAKGQDTAKPPQPSKAWAASVDAHTRSLVLRVCLLTQGTAHALHARPE